jgi:hypothetical protein
MDAVFGISHPGCTVPIQPECRCINVEGGATDRIVFLYLSVQDQLQLLVEIRLGDLL